jgi:hypothetical protein
LRLSEGCDDVETPDMSNGIGVAEALLGLPGFRIVDLLETDDELVVTVESTADRVGCETCGVRAQAQDRTRVEIRDLSCFGRPARLVWHKRRWRCADGDCGARTWTERSEHVDAQAVITRRAGAEACRQVGDGTELSTPRRCFRTGIASAPAKKGRQRARGEGYWAPTAAGVQGSTRTTCPSIGWACR